MITPSPAKKARAPSAGRGRASTGGARGDRPGGGPGRRVRMVDEDTALSSDDDSLGSHSSGSDRKDRQSRRDENSKRKREDRRSRSRDHGRSRSRSVSDRSDRGKDQPSSRKSGRRSRRDSSRSTGSLSDSDESARDSASKSGKRGKRSTPSKAGQRTCRDSSASSPSSDSDGSASDPPSESESSASSDSEAKRTKSKTRKSSSRSDGSKHHRDHSSGRKQTTDRWAAPAKKLIDRVISRRWIAGHKMQDSLPVEVFRSVNNTAAWSAKAQRNYRRLLKGKLTEQIEDTHAPGYGHRIVLSFTGEAGIVALGANLALIVRGLGPGAFGTGSPEALSERTSFMPQCCIAPNLKRRLTRS